MARHLAHPLLSAFGLGSGKWLPGFDQEAKSQQEVSAGEMESSGKITGGKGKFHVMFNLKK